MYGVSGVIEYLKRQTDFGTKYIANLNPRIQLCFFDKSVFNGYEYKIVYPNEYATVVDMTDMTI